MSTKTIAIISLKARRGSETIMEACGKSGYKVRGFNFEMKMVHILNSFFLEKDVAVLKMKIYLFSLT